MTEYERWALIAQCITGIAAILFAFLQLRINSRLKKLQAYIAVSIIPSEQCIKILNVGKVNLYIHGFNINDHRELFEEGRLVSAGTLDSSYYWIPLPSNIPHEGQFEIRLWLKDEFGDEYQTLGKGESRPYKEDKVHIQVYTLRTNKLKWSNNI